jgi:cytidylate kinase
LTAWQRRHAAGRHLVTEGRDQGTAVFPDAACKFYLTAAPAERARRRLGDLRARGDTGASLEAVACAQAERDERDTHRALAPLRLADDAVVLDSTALDVDAVVDRMERHVRDRMPRAE